MIRRWGWLVAVIAVVAIVLIAGTYFIGAESGTLVPAFVYRQVDDDTIILVTETGDANWTRITNVTETASEVRITINALRAPVVTVGGGEILELTVDLQQPLGDRKVYDGIHEMPVELP